MRDYEVLHNDSELNGLLASINESDTDAYSACHGSYHANFVVNRTGEILAALHFGERMVEIGKIAGLLHDIGCISGKKGHAEKSAQMCGKFLAKTNVNTAERDIITQAIAGHSKGNKIESAVGAALLIADKTDLSRDRIINPEDINNYHKNLFEVERVDVSVEGKAITVNFTASDKFSTAVLYELWSKAFTMPVKAGEYLGCSVLFAVNGARVDIICT